MVNFNDYQEQQHDTSMNMVTQKSKSVLAGDPQSEHDEINAFESLFDKLLKENKIDPSFLLKKLKQHENNVSSDENKKYQSDALLDE